MLDEEAAAACWAWEQDYIGMEIAGTIHNEVRIDGPLDSPVDEPAAIGQAQTGGPARTQRRWPLDPATRAADGP